MRGEASVYSAVPLAGPRIHLDIQANAFVLTERPLDQPPVNDLHRWCMNSSAAHRAAWRQSCY